MSTQSSEEQLRDALAKLEAALELPIVPGEMASWIPAVHQGFADVGTHLRYQIERGHTEQLRRIRKEDLGLARRVEQLADEDLKLLEQYGELARLAEQLNSAAIAIEPDEAAVEPEVTRLVDEGLAFIIRVRKQEAAIATWLVEALERDRGDVD